jgi:pimeloyl-ACP methyl ester carboxylesterase
MANQMIYSKRMLPEENREMEETIVILVHGLAASHFDWIELQPALATIGYESISLDLPGHGNSSFEIMPLGYSHPDLYTDFATWIGSVAPSKPIILIAHSLGAYLAIQYCSNHLDDVKALVLVDPLYDNSQFSFGFKILSKASFFEPSILQKIPESWIESFMGLFGKVIRNGFRLPDAVVQQTLLDYQRSNPEILNYVKELHDLSPMINSLEIPALIVWGDKDRTLPVWSFSELAKHIKGSETQIIRGAGHVPHQSHSNLFNQIVLAFLENQT